MKYLAVLMSILLVCSCATTGRSVSEDGVEFDKPDHSYLWWVLGGIVVAGLLMALDDHTDCEDRPPNPPDGTHIASDPCFGVISLQR